MVLLAAVRLLVDVLLEPAVSLSLAVDVELMSFCLDNDDDDDDDDDDDCSIVSLLAAVAVLFAVLD